MVCDRTGLYLAERGIANQIQRIRSGPLPWPEIDADKALPWIEQKTGLALAASQAEWRTQEGIV